MIKKVFILIFSLFFTVVPAFAQKIPVKIAPMQVVSTHYDEIQVGDYVSFEVVNNVYKNEKLYIKKGSTILGKVSFVHPNGWNCDNAEISFKYFYTRNCDNQKITINLKCPLIIKGRINMALNWRQFIRFAIFYPIRGTEIFIEPDTRIYNIFIEQ